MVVSRYRTGTTAGARTVGFAGAEGTTYRLRVTARDEHGNHTMSAAETVTVPVDDGSLVYPETGWTPIGSLDSFFRRTAHTASAGSAELVVPFQGMYVAWIAPKGPGLGSADVLIDGGPPETVHLTTASDSSRQVVFERDGLAPGPHTITIRPTVGEIAVDALAAR